MGVTGATRRERAAERLRELLSHERAIWSRGRRLIAGVDEVGVGPLAGPVVAAAVVLPEWVEEPGVDDSKKLSPAQRARAAERIRSVALGVGMGMVDVEDIDRLNIYHASLLAMRRAVEALPVEPEWLLVDARTIPGVAAPQTAIVKGDQRCYSIAAASIVAKVARDDLMVRWHQRYPQYGFARHMGYGTREHRAALARYGPCAIHRRSFEPVRQALLPGL